MLMQMILGSVFPFLCRLLKLEEIKRSGTGGRQDPYMYKVKHALKRNSRLYKATKSNKTH